MTVPRPSGLSEPGQISLTLLGRIELRAGSRDITPKSRKARALLAIAALSRSPVQRSRLIHLLWGDRGDEQARASLRQALYELRDLTGSNHLKVDRERVGIGRAGLITDIDLLVDDAEYSDARTLADRLDSIGWPILGGIDDLSEELDAWIRDERQHVSARLIQAGRSAAERAEAIGDIEGARELLDRLERLDPIDEPIARQSILLALRSGDRSGAAKRLSRLTKSLESELGVAPSPETEALLREVSGPVSASAARVTNPAAASPGRKPPFPRPLAIAAAVALLVAAAALVGFRFFAPGQADSPTVAVLPFSPVDKGQTFLAEGLSDEVLNMLGNQDRFRVLGRISSTQLGEAKDALASARKLGITHLLDGSVMSQGDRMVVIARLTRVVDGAQLWSERYERPRADLFGVQANIAQAVAARLNRSFAATPTIATSPEAYERYLAARQLVRERRENTLGEADRLLREAIRIDPNYAPAFAELAQVQMLLADHPVSYGQIPIAKARRDAEAFARRAVALDPNLGDGYAALGFLTFSNGSAESLYRKAVSLTPQRSEFHRWHAQSLADLGRHDEALEEYRRAVEIDPLWGLNYDHLAGALMSIGRVDEARQVMRRFLTLSTDDRTRRLLQVSMARFERRYADAYRISAALLRDYPSERLMRFNHASSAAALGDYETALRVSREDPLASAVLSEDWDALAEIAARTGPEFWDLGLFWDAHERLVEAGRGDVIVRLYERSKARIAKNHALAEKVATPATIVALRRAGLVKDADRLIGVMRARLDRLPDHGDYGVERDYGYMALKALAGDDRGALALADRLTRAYPLALPRFPGHSMLNDPAMAPIARDPRLGVMDERVRRAINAERSKIGLRDLTQAEWRGHS